MNKAITDGLMLMPPPFSAGLDVWSSEDGTPGSPTYEGAANAAFVPSDADFGGCLELQKTEAVQRLRYMGETPILPGCYLRVRVRLKAISGNLPEVRIAGWAGGAGNAHVADVPQQGDEVALEAYGEVVTVSAIIGTGSRPGVDLAWGLEPIYGHFGIDLTGPTGGVVRIDDIEIEDVTAVFHRKMMDWVDVKDYGAAGDGVTDDHAAFLAADAAAQGRQILVPEGGYHIGAHLTLNAPVRFEGTLVMAPDTRLQLTRSYDFPTYQAAFGSDDLGFRKAMQALFHFTDHVTLDLKGRRVRLEAPVDVHATANNLAMFEMRRCLTNGMIDIQEGPAWDSATWTRQATYDPAQPRRLSDVANVAQIAVGARVSGAGVGREVYVTETNPGAGTITLSQPLFDAEGTQSYTFTRDRYALDFSGFDKFSKFEITEIEFLLKGEASGMMLAPEGLTHRMADCVFNRPRDRGITSIGRGCQGLLVDRCQFLSDEMPVPAQDRTSVAMNINANDAKIRNNRAVMFAAFCVANGSGHLFVGNHFFQGDSEPQGLRQAGLVLTQTNVKTTITGNYIDNCAIEWTNEHSADPAQLGFSFGGLTITGNIFTCNGVAPFFRWLVIKPFAPGHFVNGLNISGNVFRTINGAVERVEMVDTTHADLNYAMFRNISVQGNAFNGVDQRMANPVTLRHDQNTAQGAWTINVGPYLPFGGWARNVTAIVPEGEITGPNDERRTDFPYASTQMGAENSEVRINWASASKGRVLVTARVDNPV
ncbi:glycosyl hydrolase family 28-related protein [Alkalilacustris brevis]|uniref:glycosyl hydrolase family 28-related protein n=1 Tax=Alkalilacustris brevis TaxID=2026338 RepID=UPI000E0D7575|nr:glycosyl hydrolase family 28-related protein [Alkalilacustris brevis]